MRVALDTLFTTPLRFGSIVDYVRGVIRYTPVVAPDIELVVLVSARNRALYEPVRAANVTFVECGASNERRVLRILSQQLLMPGVLRRQRVDVLYACADVAPLFTAVPVVLKVNTFHHYHEPWALGRMRSRYRRGMIGTSARRAFRVIANSGSTFRDIVTLLHVPENRVELIYEAVDPLFQQPVDESARRKVRDQYGLRAPFLFFVSKLYPYKGADTLIRAFALLAERGVFGGELVIAGSDHEGERGRLEALAQRLGVAARTRFLGGVPNEAVPALLGSAELLVYPSLHETFGKPVVEAMQTGVPIVASSAGSIPEIVGDAAELVPPGDPAALAGAMEMVLASPTRRAQLVARGLERGREFSWEKVARSLVTVWRRAAGRASAA